MVIKSTRTNKREGQDIFNIVVILLWYHISVEGDYRRGIEHTTGGQNYPDNNSWLLVISPMRTNIDTGYGRRKNRIK